MTPRLLTAMRELDRRQADGVDVRLLWCEADGSVLVAVKDHQTGEAFSVEVQEADRALEVFKHPYVYQRGSERADRSGLIEFSINRAAEQHAELRRV